MPSLIRWNSKDCLYRGLLHIVVVAAWLLPSIGPERQKVDGFNFLVENKVESLLPFSQLKFSQVTLTISSMISLAISQHSLSKSMTIPLVKEQTISIVLALPHTNQLLTSTKKNFLLKKLKNKTSKPTENGKLKQQSKNYNNNNQKCGGNNTYPS